MSKSRLSATDRRYIQTAVRAAAMGTEWAYETADSGCLQPMDLESAIDLSETFGGRVYRWQRGQWVEWDGVRR